LQSHGGAKQPAGVNPAGRLIILCSPRPSALQQGEKHYKTIAVLEFAAMRHRQKGLSSAQWLAIIGVELLGCLGLVMVLWGVFVNPTPPDFSNFFVAATQPTATLSPTLPPTLTFTPSATATRLPPTPESTATPVPTLTPTAIVSAQVIDNGVGLNMRAGPDSSQPIIARLLPLTQLTLVGRTSDNTWLLATTARGETGWVSAEFVNISGSLESVPVSTATVAAASLTPTEITPTATPPPPLAIDYPYLTGLTENSRQIFLRGQQLGNRAGVFSKVGDSITANENFLIPIGRGRYVLDEHTYLQPVIDYFSQTEARHGNSFVNDSLTAYPGWSSWTAINAYAADENVCAPGEMPIACELRMVKPAFALIMLGTNDVPDDDTISANVYEGQMRRVIETCLNAGVVPIVSTIPNFHRETGYRVAIFNDVLVELTDEYDIPLWNYWAALQGLPNDGLSSDGVHPSVAPTFGTDLTPEALQYGMNMRNLTALQALDAVWRYTVASQ
jgi:hypothetical protein